MSINKPFIIGLTGPIGAGKSTVAQILAKLGAYIIDADSIGHQIITAHTPAWEEIITAFGGEILLGDESIDRKKLGKLVFGNLDNLRVLNNITHPRILNRVQCLISEAEAKSKHNFVVINAAVLEEMQLIQFCNKVWVVLADKEKRLERLGAKGLDKDTALARIEAQGDDEHFRRIADLVIKNNGTVGELAQLVEKEYKKLKF